MLLCGAAHAFPTRPVTMIVPQPPCGADAGFINGATIDVNGGIWMT